MLVETQTIKTLAVIHIYVD